MIFALSFFDSKIREIKEFDKLQKAVVIGAVGHSVGSNDVSVYENPKSALAESFRALRTNLQYLLREANDKVISITSTISGEGKTFCAINLASILAMSNKKVVLMGLDLRKPKLHKVLNISNEVGISTYLIHKTELEAIIHPTKVPNMFVAVSGPVPPNPSELIETKEMSDLVAQLREQFDYVIIDTPPVAIVTDALLIAPLANCTVFVARQNYSVKDVIKLADDLAHREEIKHLSVLVNDVSAPSYYGYSYKYGYGYGGYGGYGAYSYTYGQKHGYYGDEEITLTFKQKLKRVFEIGRI
jgi:capsular exopolysaccharide synthesis family protein